MEADVPYRFNIINCEKFNSQFNFGEFLEIFVFHNLSITLQKGAKVLSQNHDS